MEEAIQIRKICEKIASYRLRAGMGAKENKDANARLRPVEKEQKMKEAMLFMRCQRCINKLICLLVFAFQTQLIYLIL